MSKGKKTGGRQKGTPNKTTADIRFSVNTFISNNIDSIQATFDKLEPIDQLKFIDRMLHYTLPKLSSEVLPPPQIKKNLPKWMLSSADAD
jgi:hypothetical protein